MRCTYFICPLSINQHSAIDGPERITDDELKEVNKFYEMMALLKLLSPDFAQVRSRGEEPTQSSETK